MLTLAISPNKDRKTPTPAAPETEKHTETDDRASKSLTDEETREHEREIDDTLKGTFPASDPPSWTL